jgi:hypothetical protein
MKGKKILFLALALLLPGAVFIFLKMFGRNEFSVPALYQAGIIDTPAPCQFSYTAPYTVPDSVAGLLRLRGDSVYVLYFDPALAASMKRVSVELRGSFFRIISPSDIATSTGDPAYQRECIFLLDSGQSVVLLDNQQRIRGHYIGVDRDEIDRLIVEMSIILKRY